MTDKKFKYEIIIITDNRLYDTDVLRHEIQNALQDVSPGIEIKKYEKVSGSNSRYRLRQSMRYK
jgi:hypothetical protein